MARFNQNPSAAEPTVAENAAELKADRRDTMSSIALRRVAQGDTQQISPSPTPSKNINASGNPELSQAVREQWNVSQEETTKPKASLQDVKNIGQSLKQQGVNTSEVSQGNSRAEIEKSFDSHQGTGSTPTQGKPLSETAKVTAQARQTVQKDNLKSQSMER